MDGHNVRISVLVLFYLYLGFLTSQVKYKNSLISAISVSRHPWLLSSHAYDFYLVYTPVSYKNCTYLSKEEKAL